MKNFLYDERILATNIYNNGFKNGYDRREALLLAKYFRHILGYGDTRIRKKIIEACSKDIYFNAVSESSAIKSFVRNSKKDFFVKTTVFITKKEIEKAKTIKNYKKSLTKNAFAVKKLGYKELDLEMPVYDITVDCDTHSFIANNMIVHNSTCLTRVRTANGVAQMTAIMDVSEAKKRIEKIYSKKVYFISDGGCKESGDICKALCFADMVMVGNLFAGTTEAPGNVVFGSTGALYKEYVGSSTHKSHYVEGVKGMVPFKGGVLEVLEELLEGLRSCCSYQGCDNLIDLKEDPEFMSISSAGLKESKAHDVTVSLV